MDTGGFEKPLAYEEYKIICLSMGISRDWEIELSYKIYLYYENRDYKKASLMEYYNYMYFREGSFN